jgi:Ca2+:H+ antiporter
MRPHYNQGMPTMPAFPTLLGLPLWSIVTPLLAGALLLAGGVIPAGLPWLIAISLGLIAAVLVSVFHAEVIAHRIGEPFGTLVLALAVTVIEVSLIVSIMLSGGGAPSELARDTVFATVMIICNGVVGLCLLAGAWRHRIISFSVEGTGSALSVLTALTTLTLVLPKFTTTTSGPTYSPSQLVFAGLMSLILYSVFVFVQTVRHREFFLPVDTGNDDEHVAITGTAGALLSFCMLVVALLAVVGLAKQLSPVIQRGVEAAAAPAAVVGIAIALLVLLPETWAALRAALRNRMQTSLNLALGSALATIGLTIPCVAVVSIYLELPLVLGLPSKEIVLLVLTLLSSVITLASGRATVLQGAVHLVIFAAFLFLAVIP